MSKIILFDVETSLMKFEITGFGLGSVPDYLSHKSIVQDWSIICACWRELGKKTIYSASVSDNPSRMTKDPYDDLDVVKRLHKMFKSADILIAHNCDGFDVKKCNARFIYHGLPPVPPIRTIDTLKEARKIAKFTSNRLDYLGQMLGVGGKLETENGLWEKARMADIAATRRMVKYCKRDVDLLEKVYLKLRPYMKSHPNMASDDTMNCPKCNSSNRVKVNNRVTASGIRRRQYQCKDCGGYYTERMRLKEKSLSAK